MNTLWVMQVFRHPDGQLMLVEVKPTLDTLASSLTQLAVEAPQYHIDMMHINWTGPRKASLITDAVYVTLTEELAPVPILGKDCYLTVQNAES